MLKRNTVTEEEGAEDDEKSSVLKWNTVTEEEGAEDGILVEVLIKRRAAQKTTTGRVQAQNRTSALPSAVSGG